MAPFNENAPDIIVGIDFGQTYTGKSSNALIIHEILNTTSRRRMVEFE